MTKEGHLKASWDIQNVQGHPRKFYSITPQGKKLFELMKNEFDQMDSTFHLACALEKIQEKNIEEK